MTTWTQRERKEIALWEAARVRAARERGITVTDDNRDTLINLVAADLRCIANIHSKCITDGEACLAHYDAQGWARPQGVERSFPEHARKVIWYDKIADKVQAHGTPDNPRTVLAPDRREPFVKTSSAT